jgi:hypothetical protein
MSSSISHIRALIREMLMAERIKNRSQIAPAPKFGSILDSGDKDKKKATEEGRPDNGGMDISQHKKMMYAESPVRQRDLMDFMSKQNYYNPEDESNAIKLAARIRSAPEGADIFGLLEKFKQEGNSEEDIYLAYYVAKILTAKETEGSIKEEDNEEKNEADLTELSAVGGGGVVGYTGPLGFDTSSLHATFWSGNEPTSRSPGSSSRRKKKV